MQEWLSQPVPLWAFLVALLTAPSKWSSWAKKMIQERLSVTKTGDKK